VFSFCIVRFLYSPLATAPSHCTYNIVGGGGGNVARREGLGGNMRVYNGVVAQADKGRDRTRSADLQ